MYKNLLNLTHTRATIPSKIATGTLTFSGQLTVVAGILVGQGVAQVGHLLLSLE